MITFEDAYAYLAAQRALDRWDHRRHRDHVASLLYHAARLTMLAECPVRDSAYRRSAYQIEAGGRSAPDRIQPSSVGLARRASARLDVRRNR